MRHKPRFSAVIFAIFVMFNAVAGHAQQPLPTATMPETSPRLPVGVGVKLTTLGPGAELAVATGQNFNLRAGANFLQYSFNSSREGSNYSGTLRLQTLEAHADWFPLGGKFHLGPGFLYFLKQPPIRANLQIPPGNDFTLGTTGFTSSVTDPTTGVASINAHRAAPTLTAGWGNLVPRGDEKHWSFPVEFGVALQGAPHISMTLQGQACENGICYDAALDPHVLGPLAQEIKKRQDHVSWLKVYPLISAGVGYRF